MYLTLIRQSELSDQQTWSALVASAIARRNPQLTAALVPEAERHLTTEALGAAKAAAAIMGMNNVYCRFQHLVENENYAAIPVDFELWRTAVSAINGCGASVVSQSAYFEVKV